VCPGAHHIGAVDEGVSVVWWAPDALALGAQASLGLRRDDLIVRDVSPGVLRQRLADHAAWQTSRAAALEKASQPSVRVLTVTEWAASMEGDTAGTLPDAVASIEVTVETVTAVGTTTPRPAGSRFGTLVHAVLAAAPLDGTNARLLAQLVEAHGRVLGAEPEEMEVALTVVRRVLTHPLMRAAATAAAAGRCYRETPVTWRLDACALVEGVADLAFMTDEGVTVVDFKTDRELDSALDRYRRQVQIYAAAIGFALGRPARGVLMRV